MSNWPDSEPAMLRLTTGRTATSIIFVMTMFCQNKTHLMSRQKYACRNETFVTTKLCLLQQNIFVMTKHIFCHDKIMQVPFLCDKHAFVMTKVLLWQTWFCCDKFCQDKHTFVTTKDVFCHDKHMLVVTKLLSQQKWYLWQLQPMIETKEWRETVIPCTQSWTCNLSTLSPVH